MAVDERLIEYERENTILRGLLARSGEPCIYCELPRARMGECESGFPGCGRMDDLLVLRPSRLRTPRVPMKSSELAEIKAGANRYHTMSSEVVKRLVAELERLQAKVSEYETNKQR